MRLLSRRALAFPSWLMGGLLACALHFSPFFSEARPTDEIRLQGLEMSPLGTFRFYFDASADQSYHIETSTNLQLWMPLTNVLGTGQPLWIEDQDASKFPRRFYHIGLRPAEPTPITNMVFIPPGSFTIGSPQSESGRDPGEGPQTLVTISRGFWMGKFEVIQADYIAVAGQNQSTIADVRRPVDFVTWNHATNYCHKLTERERAEGRLPPGFRYRLPTEAEWEYACRAGTTTPVALGEGHSLSSAQANFDGGFPYGNAPEGPFLRWTSIPGSYPPNAWGLYDMHGNVAEWCQDVFAPYPGGTVTDPKGPETGAIRVIRGGSWKSPGEGCRSARREGRAQTLVQFPHGFRVVLASDP